MRIGGVLAWVENQAASIVSRAEERAGAGFLGRRFPRSAQALKDALGFVTADTERVYGPDGVLEPKRSIGLSLSSTVAAGASLVLPGSLVAVPAMIAAGLGWWSAVGVLASSAPYLIAAAGQGVVGATSDSPGFRRAAITTAKKNLELGAVYTIPFLGTVGAIAALGSQVKHRAALRQHQEAMLAGTRAALEPVLTRKP